VVFIVYLKLLKCPIEDNKALLTASYLLVRANYKRIKYVVLSALMTTSYLLSVLSSLISGCLDFRPLHANYMSGGICSSATECPIEARDLQ